MRSHRTTSLLVHSFRTHVLSSEVMHDRRLGSPKVMQRWGATGVRSDQATASVLIHSFRTNVLSSEGMHDGGLGSPKVMQRWGAAAVRSHATASLLIHSFRTIVLSSEVMHDGGLGPPRVMQRWGALLRCALMPPPACRGGGAFRTNSKIALSQGLRYYHLKEVRHLDLQLEPLGPLGFNFSQHGSTTHLSVERTADKAFLLPDRV